MLTLSLGAAACSNLPGTTYPPFTDHAVAFAFTVQEPGHLPLPSTSSTLQLHALTAEPPPAREWYDAAGQRWFGYQPGTRVVVRARCRIYADDHGTLRTLGEVFPGGELLTDGGER